jgi:hypothetical protein
MIVRETINFERGKDPIKNMDIGQAYLDKKFIEEQKWWWELDFLKKNFEILGVIKNYKGYPILKLKIREGVSKEQWKSEGFPYICVSLNRVDGGKFASTIEKAVNNTERLIDKKIEEKGLKESLNFERTGDPMQSMKIGIKAKIDSWLEENVWYHSKKPEYRINEDLTIDFFTDCDLRASDSPTMIIPEYIKFNEIHGFFTFPGRKVESLIGWSPKIVYGSYYCNANLLTSLDGCPEIVERDFSCYENAVNFTEEYVRSKCKVGRTVLLKRITY